jgi:hypothetical protein
MKIRRPRLFTVISFVSLVLCVALGVVWWRSRGITVAARPSTAQVQRGLAWRTAVSFNTVALADAIDFLRDVTGLKIEVDWEALEAAKIDANTITSAQSSGATMGEVLNSILASAGANTEFNTEGSTVRISVKGAPWRELSVVNPNPALEAIRQFELKNRGNVPLPSPPEPVLEQVVGENRYTLVLDRGVVRLWRTPTDPAAVYQQGAPIGKDASPDAIKVFERGGISIRRSGSPFNTWVVALPFWFLIVITAICPLLWMRRALRRKAPYRCAHCGYDLRATPDLCPECGKAPAAISATASGAPPA